MKLKLDAAGNVVVQNGMPVYVYDDGKEIPFDAPSSVAKITTLNGEAMGHRQRAEIAEGKLKDFEGIEDPKAAKAALETVKNFDGGKLVDAAKVQERIDGAVRATEEKYKPYIDKSTQLEGALRDEIIGGGFSRSEFIAKKLAVPVDMAQSTFGKYFSVVEGQLVAKGYDGKEILSRAKPGSPATFDEAMEVLVDGYSHKTAILRGTGQQGNNVNPGNGGGGSGGNGVDLSALSPTARLTAARAAQSQ